MRLINSLRSYILEDEFKVNIYKNKINIVNYSGIGHFDSNKVTVNYNDGQIIISGTNLVVSRLLNDEVLITGTINNIELR